MKNLLVLLVPAAMLAFVAQAVDPVTFYVNASQADDTGDGLTPATAKKYIQSGVDLACASGAGNTVSVAEGLYNEGANTCHWDSRIARVVITNRVNLVASGRKEKTIIDGGGSMTGIHIYYSTASSAQKKSANSIVRGFTVTNCRNAGNQLGVAISMWSSYAVDCVISNNVSTYRGAGTYLGTALRCLYADNYSQSAGAAMYQTVCMNCVIVGQRGGQSLSGYAGSLYNCTVVGNDIKSYSFMSSAPLYNTIYLGNTTQSIFESTTVLNKCIVSSDTTNYDKDNSTVKTEVPDYCFMGPQLGDWRSTAALGAAEYGDADYLALPTLPAALEADRYLDYNGQSIPKTGAITCGAVQAVGAAMGEPVTFDGAYAVAGYGQMVTNASMAAFRYYWTDDLPGMIKFKNLDQPFEKVIWYNLTTNASSARVAQLAPMLDNWAGFVPYPGCTNHINLLKANDVYYVDAVNGDDANNGTSSSTPLASINAAIAKLPNGSSKNYAKSAIIVAPGTYTNAIDSSAVAVVNHSNRNSTDTEYVYRYTRIVAKEGPEKTVINGCDRDRCAVGSIGLFLQGFTLTGGKATSHGSALYSNSTGNSMMSDCIVSNNYVYSEKTSDVNASIAYRARIVRCRFADNRVNAYAGGATLESHIMNCEIVESVPPAHVNSYGVGGGCRLFFSTAKGSCNERSAYYYSILPGGLVMGKDGVASYCYANGNKAISAISTGKIDNCMYGNAGCCSWRQADFRLRPGADVLGRVTVNRATYAPYAQLDMDGNVVSSAALSGNAAGAHQLANADWEPEPLLLFIK